MKLKSLFLVIFIALIGCQSKENKKAAILYKKASDVFLNNHYNHDSLMYAIGLLDTAIQLDGGEVKFYLLKSAISRKLKRYDLVILDSDDILRIDKDNFLALLSKGVAFELSNHLDSAMENYGEALKSFDKMKFQPLVFKEYQRIILYGLLKDSAGFNLKLNEFQEKFKNEKGFSEYYADLKQFDRMIYINSF